MERVKPRVFPGPDILIIRNTKLGDGIATGLPWITLEVYLQSGPGRFTAFLSKDVLWVAF